MTKWTLPQPTQPATTSLPDQLRADASAAHAAAAFGYCPIGHRMERAADQLDAKNAKLTEIIMEATSRNHAIDIARRAKAEGGE